jgi:hypothetical protein
MTQQFNIAFFKSFEHLLHVIIWNQAKDSDVVNGTFENIWFGLYDALGMRIVVIFLSVGDQKTLSISPNVIMHDKTSKILKAQLTT